MKNVNLVICMTPLQVLIAEKIIGLYPNEEFYGLMIALNKNDKYNYYYERLDRACYKSKIINVQNPYIGLCIFMLYKITKFFTVNFNNVFVASVDNPFIHYVISSIKFDTLKTFDDGTANINISSVYYIESAYTLKVSLFRKILGIKVDLEYLKKISSVHYTIYENIPNIVKNTKLIRLFKLERKEEVEYNQTVKILLGQPFQELGVEKDYVHNIVNKFNPHYYYPHPREIDRIEDVSYIDTKLIFEDYIIQQIEKHPNTKFVIGGIFSTVLFNIAQLSNVELYAFKCNAISMKDDLLTKFGVKVVKI